MASSASPQLSSRELRAGETYSQYRERISKRQGYRVAIYWITGDVYEGKWGDDRRHGTGMHFYKSGNRYEGQFLKGKREGHGTFWVIDKETKTYRPTYRGHWKNNLWHVSDEIAKLGHRMQGNRQFYIMQMNSELGSKVKCRMRVDGATIKLSPVKRNIQMASVHVDRTQSKSPGRGLLYGLCGEIYVGWFSCGKRSGCGQQTYREWMEEKESYHSYNGEWANDKRNGAGTLTMVNGNVYTGHWVDDMKEGLGAYYYKDKESKYEGVWKKDVAVSGIYTRDVKWDQFEDMDDVLQLPPLEVADFQKLAGNCMTGAWHLPLPIPFEHFTAAVLERREGPAGPLDHLIQAKAAAVPSVANSSSFSSSSS